MSNSRSVIAFLSMVFLVPLSCLAHVKWFVQDEPGLSPIVNHFSLSEPVVQLWLGIIIAGVIVAFMLDRFLPPPPEKMMNIVCQRRQQIHHLFQIFVGLALLLSAVNGTILAPHLSEITPVGLFLRFIEGGVGILFIANKGVRLGAVLMMALFATNTLLFGFLFSLEYFNFLGTAIFLYLISSPNDDPLFASQFYALPLLRLHTGIALGVLAFTEKLNDPNLAIRFLDKHQVNFMKTAGFDFFTDRIFVLSAGSTELLFAFIFLLGLIPRINTLALAGFLISSNLYFFFLGKTDEAFLELSGHLPLIAVAILFILYGGGNRFRLPNLFSHKARAKKDLDICEFPGVQQ